MATFVGSAESRAWFAIGTDLLNALLAVSRLEKAVRRRHVTEKTIVAVDHLTLKFSKGGIICKT